jgi:LPXTG-motif cell wall-anchored protein
LAVLLAMVLALSLLPAAVPSIAVADEFDSLVFDPDKAYVGVDTIAPAGAFTETLIYKTYEVDSYITNPVIGHNWLFGPSENFSKMYIHVPVSYGSTVFESSSLDNASIMLKVNWGGDMAFPASATGFRSDPALVTALSEGWIVVDPSIRGANCISTGPNGEVDYNYGKAPYSVACLKAAVRYLRYGANGATIPGNKEKIFATGTSSGGCGTVTLAATGNSTLYADALSDLGAAPGRDDIFGTLASCPIVPRDYTDDAVAWQRFFWLDFAGVDTSTMTAEQKQGLAINQGLVESFKAFEPTLGLRAQYSAGSVAEGDLITTDNLHEYYLPYLKDSILTYLNNLGSKAAIDTYLSESRGSMVRSSLLNPVYAADGVTVTDIAGSAEDIWKLYIDYVYQLPGFGGPALAGKGLDPTLPDYLYDKPYISPNIQNNGVLSRADSTGYTTAGTQTFGKPTDYAVTYSPFGLSWITDPSNQGVTVSQEYLDLYKLQSDSLNPLKFILSAEETGATVAPNWFIRTGAADTVTPVTMFLNLATGLENEGYNVNAGLVWDQGHGTSSEWPQFFAWAKTLPDVLTVTFDYNDGVTPAVVVNVLEGSTVAMPQDPVREGYDFLGWFAGDTMFDFSAPVMSSMVLLAAWQLQSVVNPPSVLPATGDSLFWLSVAVAGLIVGAAGIVFARRARRRQC